MTNASVNQTKPAADLFTAPQPGAEPYDADVIQKLETAAALRGPEYQPRTRHLRSDGWARYTNRLFLESSPYLLQHAHNPVNWYPWSDEPFEAAKKDNRPVFLSVGYATCHWCHVMEEESFEDEEIAKYLNQNFVCIKVDREERPDIDAIYMTAVQALTGRGGWPMSVWLTPDRKPFYGATYFPARDGDRGAAVGFLTILEKLNHSFHLQDGRVEKAGRQITEAIRQAMIPPSGNRIPGKEILQKAAGFYRKNYDPRFGGLSGAPKFPSSLPVRFLLRCYRKTRDPDVLEMIENSLFHMAGGGIYDHVAGGFHRYSTDAQWLVPHFEKMLYDNALLAAAYLEAWQTTANADFQRVVNEILTYAGRDMTSPEGAFYSATDADSKNSSGHMEEGWYFTWTPEELETILGKERADIVKKYYAVEGAPNFEGRYIFHTPKNRTDIAAELHMSKDDLTAVIEKSKKQLLNERNQRPAPLRDEKILTAWNALMISAFARAGLAFGNGEYTRQAQTAARFILDHLYINGRLYRSYKDGQARHYGFLEDYAFFIAALIDLYEADHDIRWLKKALALDGVLKKFYEDQESGGFFTTGTDHEALIAREKPFYDGATPSGNAVAALNLLRLHSYTTDDQFRIRAEKVFKAFYQRLTETPSVLSEMLVAVDYYFDTPAEIILITPSENPDAAVSFVDKFREQFIPNRILVAADEKQAAANAKIIPLAAGKKAVHGRTTAYVCENSTCSLPAETPEEFIVRLRP